jgi:hypothetical protein
MLDTNRPALLPASAEMVAGYVDGSAQWPADAWDRFTCPKVRISVEPFNAKHQPTGYPFGDYHAASVIDVETGAFSPADAAKFVPARNVFRPGTATVYCNHSTLPAVLRACRGETYYLWLAWYVGHVPTAAELDQVHTELRPFSVVLAAWQWKSGPSYDTSAVYLPGWHDK